MKQANGHTNGHTNGTANGHTNGHAADREPVSKPGINALSILRVGLLLIAWAAIVPFLFELMSIVLASWR